MKRIYYNTNSSTKWFLYAASAALLWGTIGIAFKIALNNGAHEEWLIVGRPLVSALVSVIAIVLGYGKPGKWSVLIGFSALGPLFIVYPKAVELVGAAIASILLYTAPIWVTVLEPVMLRENPSIIGMVSVILGFLGTLLIASPESAQLSFKGILLGIGSGLSYAFYMLLARLGSSRGASTYELSVHSTLFATLEALVIIRPSRMPSIVDVCGAIYLGVFTMVLPYILHVRALQRARAHRVAIASLLEPLSATILAYIVLGERLTLQQIAGSALILLSAAMILGEEISTSVNRKTQ
ncbi:EamA family transporter [Pyrofollis japonicus]|uniref:DMT family transporter n=1 Tax=Pyrofollis japonicus TaxID=3060460 RepID=UPI00295AFB6F|nr:EamA family transporter [Pyrofollis japonicus]BEP17139.1 EamA family transporter [Pyrofollis japonicus]